MIIQLVDLPPLTLAAVNTGSPGDRQESRCSMKTKNVPTFIIPKPEATTDARPLKSLRPMRSLNGLKSLRPKSIPVVAQEMPKQ